MNVLMILSDYDFPPDIRVEKEAKTLIANNHRLFLICTDYSGNPEKEEVQGITVFRIPSLFKNKRVLWFFSSFLLIRYILLPLKILSICYNHKIHVFHVHDLPFALPSIILAKILGKKVIFDMHENYPEMIEYSLKKQKNIFFRYISHIKISTYKLEEFLSLKLVDRIICIVEEQREIITKKGAKDKKIIVVLNVIDFDELKNLSIDKKEGVDKFLIIYVGGFSFHRGLETLVNAAPIVVRDIPKALFILIGKGAAENDLKDLTADLNMKDKVVFMGWLPFEKAMEYVIESDVCAIPYIRTIQTEFSLPYKLTQYMYFSKPVITSDVKSLKRIMEETKAGITFHAGDHVDLAKKIVYLYRNKEFKDKLGKNGRKAVEEKYNWNMEEKNLIDLYEYLERELHD